MNRFGARSLDDVLAELAVPGTDPAAVAEYVNGALVVKRRRVRLAGVAAALLALAFGGTALALTGAEEPDEVVAAAVDRDDSEERDANPESSEAGSGTVVTAVPTTLAPSSTLPGIAGLTTLPRPSSPSVGSFSPAPAYPVSPLPVPTPAPSAAPATAADQPLTGTLTVTAAAGGAPVAGQIATVSLDWSDPDLPGGRAAAVRVTTDVPGMTFESVEPVPGACSGGRGAAGRWSTGIRFPIAGDHPVTVEVSTCDGAPVTFSRSVGVADPDGERPIVAWADGLDPEAGTWVFMPDEGAEQTLRNDVPGDGVADNDPRVVQYHEGKRATVLLLPDGATGTLRHDSPDGSCIRRVSVTPDIVVGNIGGCQAT